MAEPTMSCDSGVVLVGPEFDLDGRGAEHLGGGDERMDRRGAVVVCAPGVGRVRLERRLVGLARHLAADHVVLDAHTGPAQIEERKLGAATRAEDGDRVHAGRDHRRRSARRPDRGSVGQGDRDLAVRKERHVERQAHGLPALGDRRDQEQHRGERSNGEGPSPASTFGNASGDATPEAYSSPERIAVMREIPAGAGHREALHSRGELVRRGGGKGEPDRVRGPGE